MSKPILYSAGETSFTGNGIGALPDAILCTVTEERNGAFELEMQYPITGLHYGEIALRSIITAKPNQVDDPQPFRVYRITKPLNGIVTVYAAHITYDLSGIPVSPFTAGSAAQALAELSAHAAVTSGFTFWTDNTDTGTMTVALPASTRSLLGGSEGSILDIYGGEYKWDKYTVKLYSQRGMNRGVSIRYGKNLTDLTQEENCSNVYTGLYPYWVDSEGTLVQLPEKVVNASGSYNFVRVLPLDFSGDFDEQPTEAQLRQAAEDYISANHIGVPTVSLTVSFVQLEQTEEYKNTALLERVLLCDTVNVEFSGLGVSATAKCVKTVYNVLAGRLDSVELGDAKTNIADTIAGQQQSIERVPSKSFLQLAVENATALITGNKGGFVIMHSSTGGKEPDEILIMDTADIETAVKVWRWNKSGLGYSGTGYNGPYGLAMTADGQIVADYIATGTLNAAQIRVINLIADHVKSTSGAYTMELNASQLSLKSGDSYRAFMWLNPANAAAGQTEYGYIKLSQGGVAWPFPGHMDASGRVTTVTPTEVIVGQDNDGDTQGKLVSKDLIIDHIYFNKYATILMDTTGTGSWLSGTVAQDTVLNVDGERINVLRLI